MSGTKCFLWVGCDPPSSPLILPIADVSFPAFSVEACRTMICMLDEDDNGTLDFTEFQKLLQCIAKWKVCGCHTYIQQCIFVSTHSAWLYLACPLHAQVVFRETDRNHSGTIERSEAFESLQRLGFDIPAAAQSALFNRFAKQRTYMDFDDFVACCCRAELMHSEYHGLMVMKHTDTHTHT